MKPWTIWMGLALGLVACGGDEGGQGDPPEQEADAGPDADNAPDADDAPDGDDAPDADDESDVPGDPGFPANRRVVTADWLNRSLTVFDYEALSLGGGVEEARLATIDLAEHAPGPLQLELTPDGRRAVVSVSPGFFDGTTGAFVGRPEVPPGGALLIVDLEQGSVEASLTLAHIPMGVAISPDGSRAWTANFGSAEGRGSTMSVIDLTSNTVIEDIEVGRGPEQVVLNAEGTLGLINLASEGGVRLFETHNPTGTLTPVVETGNDPSDIAFVGLGRAVVTNSQSLDVALLDLTNPAAPSLLGRVSVGGGFPYGAEALPDGSVLITSTSMGTRLSVIKTDGAAPAVDAFEDLDGGPFPMNAALDDDARLVFVPHARDRTLTILDRVTGARRTLTWLTDVGPTYVAVR